jgi:streptomycin 6-kinase
MAATAGNVLRADRQPWLVIDPKPFVGDPAYDATQHLLNCGVRLRSDPENTIRRFADLLDVDGECVCGDRSSRRRFSGLRERVRV